MIANSSTVVVWRTEQSISRGLAFRANHRLSDLCHQGDGMPDVTDNGTKLANR